MRYFALLLLFLAAACDDGFDKEANRKVVSLTTEAGHPFHFMPIYEDGVSDITFRFAWPTNWADDAANNPATPYVGADVILSGGTEKLAPQDVLARFEELNARGGIDAGIDTIFGELEAPKETIEEAVAIAAEMLSRPQLEPRWIERMKTGLTEQQAEAQTISANQLWSAGRHATIGAAPLLGHVDFLDAGTIAAITAEDLAAWHRATFVQSGVTIAVTGAITPEDAGRLVDALLAGLPEGTATPAAEQPVDWSPRTILLHAPEAEKTTLAFMGPLPDTRAPGDHIDFVAINLIGSANGPLFDAIRTELRATYGFTAGYTNITRKIRPFFIEGEVETAKLAEARDVALRAYEAYRTAPDFTGFEELRENIATGTAENISYVNISARLIVELLLDGKDPAMAPQLDQLYENLTEAEVAARMMEAFPPASALITLAVSPDANALPGACVITSAKEALDCD